MKYVILQNGNLQLAVGEWEVRGFTESIKAAKDMIRDDALRYFDTDSIYDDFSEECMHYAIYELKEIVRPIPKIDVSLRLKNINKRDLKSPKT